MKYLSIIIALLLTSCDTQGVETVKLSNHLTIVTTNLNDVSYPEYKSGDSVIVWRVVGGSFNWYIETTQTEMPISTDVIIYHKGVIVK